jgi:hypothetical protein
MRLAQGQVRRVLANRAGGDDGDDQRPRHGQVPAPCRR